jgi:hypothetical protein
MAGQPITRNAFAVLKLHFFFNEPSPSFKILTKAQKHQLSSYSTTNSSDAFFDKLTQFRVKFVRPATTAAAAPAPAAAATSPSFAPAAATVRWRPLASKLVSCVRRDQTDGRK